jgi:basic membrane lipoprotein Med (substrate-binding protein (PBP1-ABC) superfamily)
LPENPPKKNRFYAIGVDTDQYLTVPEAQKVLLSSAMKSNHPRCV